MAAIGLFYGSTTGNTEAIAAQIQAGLGSDLVDLINVSEASRSDLDAYDKLIFGTSTWGIGDLQDDFETFIDELKGADLSGKKVALYGLGDSDGYPDSFVDAMGTVYQAVKAAKATVVAQVETQDYNYDASQAEIDGMFVGLALDEDSQSGDTPERLSAWLVRLKTELL